MALRDEELKCIAAQEQVCRRLYLYSYTSCPVHLHMKREKEEPLILGFTGLEHQAFS